MFFIKNKRGEELIFPVVIFIVLNLIFFSLLIIFVNQSASGTLLHEQAYAKQIALALDYAKPGMIISFDFKDGFELAEKNHLVGIPVKIQNNKVFVRLGSGNGYSFQYFSDYDVEMSKKDNLLVVKILERKNE